MGETAVKGHRSGLPACVLRPLEGVQHAGMLTFPGRNAEDVKACCELAVGRRVRQTAAEFPHLVLLRLPFGRWQTEFEGTFQLLLLCAHQHFEPSWWRC